MGEFGFQWHITDRCNLRCTHCYQTDFTANAEPDGRALCELSDRIFFALGNDRVCVNLTGGEPLLHPDLFLLIRHLHQFPNLTEINLITNGTVTNSETLEKIGESEKVQTLKISIEAADTNRNDLIRGNGVFSRVCRNIPLIQNITGKKIVLMVTLGQYNFDTVTEIAALARDLSVSGIIFERFVPLGSGRQLLEQVLTPVQWKHVVQQIVREAEIECEMADLLPYRAFWLRIGDQESGELLSGAVCNLGKSSMALMPNGDVFPCRRFPRVIGNLWEASMETIIETLGAFAPESIRPRLNGDQCSRCKEVLCVGCRALIVALTGRDDGDDPQCLKLVD